MKITYKEDMGTIKTGYSSTASMSPSRYASFKAKGEMLQVRSFTGELLGHLRPDSEHRTSFTKQGRPIIILQFDRIADRMTF
jgi:hypothetical protein